jgi:hypothetical protein
MIRNELEKPAFWPYLGRFSAVFLAAYAAAAVLFLPLQDMLPAAQRTALDFFEPYRTLGFGTVLTQLLRATVLALVLYPFYDRTVRARRAPLLLFTAVWGLGFVGSIQPMPGSLEGLLYTETALIEHAAVLTAGALQTGLFILLFLPWQRRGELQDKNQGETAAELEEAARRRTAAEAGARPKAYLLRFVLLYVAVYLTAGMLFYQISGYADALAEMEAFELYRPLESPVMAAAVFFGQFLRGTLLALMLLPFAEPCMRRRRGGLLFFALFFGTSALGGPIFIPDLFSGSGETSLGEFLAELSAGVPEILTQIFVFSLLFIAWLRRGERRRSMRMRAEAGADG